jgi:type IV secretory pathway TrbD component
MAGTLIFTFLALGGMEIVAINGLGHDAFEWWADIWIPAAVGLTTVFVSVAALVASARATRLAHAVENQREAASAERAKDAALQRVQDMAANEGRALVRWVMVITQDYHWSHRKISDTTPSTHGPTLRHDARAMLEASLVPGAAELLDITEAEVGAFWERKPDAMFMPDRRINGTHMEMYANSSTLEVRVPAVRRERMLARIRSWALDPYAAQPVLATELTALRADEDRFLDYRRGLTDSDSLPTYEPHMRLSHMFEQRAEQLREYGIEADMSDDLR